MLNSEAVDRILWMGVLCLAGSVEYSECVFVSLPYLSRMQNSTPHCIVIRGLSGCTMFFHIISTAQFSEGSYCTKKLCFDCLYNFCLKRFLFYEEIG
jgi:hypothetical protein